MAFVFENNATINPWGRGDMNNLRDWVSMKMRMRRKRYPSPPHSLLLQTRNRREVEMGASGEPEQTSCGYLRGHRNGTPPQRRVPSADTQAGVVQAAEEWAAMVDDAASWSDVAQANGTDVAQYNNQPVRVRGYITDDALVRSGARARMREDEKEMPSFSSSSFDAVTATTATNTVPADDGE